MANVYLNTGTLSLYQSSNGTSWTAMSGSSPYTLAVSKYYKLTAAAPASGQIFTGWTLTNNVDNIVQLTDKYSNEAIFNTLNQTWSYEDNITIQIEASYENEDKEFLNKRGLRDVVSRLRKEDVVLEIKEPNDLILKENSINYYSNAYPPEIISNLRIKYLIKNNKIANSTNGNGYTWEEYSNNFIWNNLEEISNMIENKILIDYDIYYLNDIGYFIQQNYLNVPEMLNQNWPESDYPNYELVEGQLNFIYDVTEDGSFLIYKTLYYIDGNFYSCQFHLEGGYETPVRVIIEDLSLINPSSVESGTRLKYLVEHPEMITLSQSINGMQEIIIEERFKAIVQSWFNDIDENAFSAFEGSDLWPLVEDDAWNENNAETDLTYNNDNWNYLINLSMAILPYNNNLYLLYFIEDDWYVLDRIEKLNASSDNAYLVLKKDGAEYEVGTQFVRKIGDTMTGSLNIIGNSSLTIGTRTYDNENIGLNSFAQGQDNLAAGVFSHAEGYSSNAIGNYSHAEGEDSTALGNNSHAEGKGANFSILNLQEDENASNKYWVIEGWVDTQGGCIRNQNGSVYKIQSVGTDTFNGKNTQYITLSVHGAGNFTAWYSSKGAIGKYSHTEGYQTTAIENSAHAEGYRTQALGLYAHAEGEETIASLGSSHAEGTSTTASGGSSHAEGNYTIASGYCAHAQNNSTKASGSASSAKGLGSNATGRAACAEGFPDLYTYITLTGAKNATTYTTTNTNNAKIGDLVAKGNNYDLDWGKIIDIVENTSITVNHTLNEYSVFTNQSCRLLRTSLASGDGSHAEGQNTLASGQISHAEGADTQATSRGDHAEGQQTIASGQYSHAEGYSSAAEGGWAHAEGQQTLAYGTVAHAEGRKTIALGYGSHTEGNCNINWDSFEKFNIRLTGSANATTYTFVTPTTSYPKTINDLMVGGFIQDYYDNTAPIIEIIAIDTTNSTIQLEKTLSTSSISNKVCTYFTPYGNAYGDYSHTEGNSTIAKGRYAHAEGDQTWAKGEASHSEGNQSIASGKWSHSEGNYTIASGMNAHAEGGLGGGVITLTGAQNATTYTTYNTFFVKVGDFIQTTSSDNISNSSAKIVSLVDNTSVTLDKTISSDAAITNKDCYVYRKSVSSGKSSHVEGAGTVASADYTHAEGWKTTASGYYSHAEGMYSEAREYCSHAEGQETVASGYDSHAEGITTIASGDYSHAEGSCYEASGDWSHAENCATYATGDCSHAEGLNTIAQRKSQHTEGEYNIADTTGSTSTRGTYVHITGNGTTNNARSNAYTLDWSGNGWYAGDVYVGSTSGTNKDSGSKKLATENYVDTAINNLPEPMIFKGSLGTGGTITALPVNGTANIGDTYKVITAGTYASQAAKVGDTFICLTKTSSANTWELIPSGDEPSGTVTSITIQGTSPIVSSSSSAITTSGTRTISHATSGVSAGTYKSVTVDTYGHVTGGTNPTTISGYGITDAKIASGTITLGSNTITPLTSSSTLDATKVSGTLPTNTYTDTKNTAGSTDTSNKIYLVGATEQSANPQTYSDNEVYTTSGTLTAKEFSLGTNAKIVYNTSESCIEFNFS